MRYSHPARKVRNSGCTQLLPMKLSRQFSGSFRLSRAVLTVMHAAESRLSTPSTAAIELPSPDQVSACARTSRSSKQFLIKLRLSHGVPKEENRATLCAAEILAREKAPLSANTLYLNSLLNGLAYYLRLRHRHRALAVRPALDRHNGPRSFRL
jgi:hypothetical protein